MRKYNITVKEDEEVIEIKKKTDGQILARTSKGEYESRAIIIASGKVSRELGVPGEKEFKNKGLTYCATCDGPLFSGKNVAVIGGGNSTLDAGLQLVKIASRVYVINNTRELGGDAVMREKLEKNDIAKMINNAEVTAIVGDRFVNGIKIKKDGREETLPVQGVFVEIGLVPNSGFAKEIEKNAHAEIKISCKNETNVPGIFAAGDVTDVPEKQIVIAAGEGAKAALSAFKYINKNR